MFFKGPSKSFPETAKIVIGSLLVMILPIFAPIFFLDRFFIEEETDTIHSIEARLERELQVFMFESDPKEVFFKSFYKLFRHLEKKGFTSEAFKGTSGLIPDFLSAQVCGFTSDGTLIIPEGMNCSSKYVVKKLWEDFLYNTALWEQKKLKMFRALFGSQFITPDARDEEGLFHSIGPGSTDGAMIWHKSIGKSGLLSFLPEFPSPLLTITNVLKSVSRKKKFYVFDPGTNYFFGNGNLKESFKRELIKSSLKGGGTFFDGKYFCRSVRHPSGLWVMRAVPFVNRNLHFRMTIRFIGLLFFLLICFWTNRIGTTVLSVLKISPRILILFVLAVAVPALLLISLGIASFKERETILKQQVYEKDLEKLRDADSAYQKHQERLVNMFRRFKKRLGEIGDSEKEFSKIYYPLRLKEEIATLVSFAIDGSIINSDERGNNFEKMLSVFAKETIKKYHKVKVPSSGESFETFAKNLLLSSRIGISGIFDRPDSVFPMALGKKYVSFYWDIVRPTEKSKMACLISSQLRMWDLKFFLSKSLPAGVIAFDNTLRKWSPGFPPIYGMKALAAQALLGNRAVSQIFQYKGTFVLATAFPSLALPAFCYLTFSDLKEVSTWVATFRNFLILGAILTVVLAVLSSMMLSGAILKPIYHLSKGIEAHEKKNLTFKVPELGNDELGRLGQVFNQMMDEMRDVSFAQEVQKSLIPTIMPDFPGYDIGMVNFTATDLGGDYCDALPMPDNRLLLITGDVTGHGIASALLTAMAKTICYLNASEGKGLQTLVERLNRLVNEAVHKKKLMTIVAAIIDGTSNSLEWTCVGHPYPLFRKADGSVTMLQMPQYPLGVRSKAQWKTGFFEMEPGSSLLFYTDGLVESLNPKGEMFDFGNLQKVFSDVRSDSAKGIIAEILYEFRSHTQGIPCADDLTLLVFRRKNCTQT
ncbi:MAG: SpoIIE family protein phosphatase [Candidatus Riflebacteria bacterium]|nr:SpoIIE family protein phosphatase [Candidatus Riflebacteria bacterium]